MDTTKFTAQLEESSNRLWSVHFIVPKAIAEQFITKESKRVVCTINDAVHFQCGILFGKKDTTLITVNSKIRKQLKLEIGDSVAITLQKDESEYGLPMPEEFFHSLQLDFEADKLFHSLTPGTQRTLLYIAGNIKNSNGRIIRALAILNHLKQNNGKVDFHNLNEEIKLRARKD